MFNKLGQNGFEQVLAKPSIITQVTFSLQTQSHKLRTLAADVLAAVCILSSSEGHKLVVDAFSDFRVVYAEDARFSYLVSSISIDDEEDSQMQEEMDDASLWEYRAAGMALINAIVNSPQRLEERMLLREEFARRGLNETMTVSDAPGALARAPEPFADLTFRLFDMSRLLMRSRPK